MSARTKITNALVEKLKLIDGTGIFKTNLFGNVFNRHMFYDEINDFPAIYVVPGSESREYLPSDFKWGYLNIALKVYVKDEDSSTELENLFEDIEYIIDNNRQLVYDTAPGAQTTEILISSIVTDEGLLAPYGVGEVSLMVRYQVLN
jgi:hypothetical protein